VVQSESELKLWDPFRHGPQLG